MMKTTTRSNKFVTTRIIRRPRVCVFCEQKTDPEYKEVAILSRFVNDRGKIVAGYRSGVCGYHQRGLTTAIARARHLALLPFVTKAW